jgi:hypothetical protein
MNYFFGIKNSEFLSEIQIPTFQNRNPNSVNISLFKAYPENNKWNITELKNNRINDDFFLLKNEEISNKDIFFLAYQNNLYDYDYLKLKNFNNFTDTAPAYRANFKILLNDRYGFSSYQSEYPFEMTIKKGTILSAVSSIANKEAEKNYIFIRNIFQDPITVNFKAYLVNINLKKIEDEFDIKTNFTNSFELKKSLIKPEIFLITKDYLGIPMYVSVDNKHVSFEHTHPPHEYILSKNKFEKISELKKEINEIIN